MSHPLLLAIFTFAAMFVAAYIGDAARSRARSLAEEERDLLGVVLSATLMLLGLLIGFSFSMAVSRYDQRKDYEEAEANAIGTEYIRAGLLPADEATEVRTLLKRYLDQRVLFYKARDRKKLSKVNSDTTELQNKLWSAALAGVNERPLPVVTIAVSGMNDVLNSQGYTQAAWRNRIPIAAWALMVIIAILCNFLIGFSARRTDCRLFIVVPAIFSIAFFLIGDIERPRGGVIHVVPENLVSTAESLR